ncbi:MAG TPA: hypothetical protein VFW91_21265, partial [Candidatus Binatia bacterium]|nr:hypothetical protein [Candidatus Binatia bacterium]
TTTSCNAAALKRFERSEAVERLERLERLIDPGEFVVGPGLNLSYPLIEVECWITRPDNHLEGFSERQ